MTRKSTNNTLAFKIGVLLTLGGAAATFGLIYKAALEMNPGLKIVWAVDPCSGDKSSADANAFANHMVFMAMAFGLFGPVGAISYFFLEDLLKVPHSIAKWVHGFMQMGATLASVLGFLQIFYAHGGHCGPEGKHFQSMHSFLGIFVLCLFWAQWPLGLTFFSNTVLLPAGSVQRKTFHRYHIFLGTAAVLMGLATVGTGVLVLIGKNTAAWPGSTPLYGYFARAGMFAWGTALIYGFTMFEAKSSPIVDSGKQAVEQYNPIEDVAAGF